MAAVVAVADVSTASAVGGAPPAAAAASTAARTSGSRCRRGGTRPLVGSGRPHAPRRPALCLRPTGGR